LTRNSYNNFNLYDVIDEDVTDMLTIRNAYKTLGGMTEINP